MTLIEVLVAMGIATIAGILLVVIIVNSAGIFTAQSSQVTEGLNINDTLSLIRGDIKQASAVATSYISGSTTYTSNASQLVLKVASIDSIGNIIDNAFDYYVLYLDQNAAIHLKIFPDVLSFRKSSDRVLATNVDKLNLKYFNSVNPPAEVSPPNATNISVTLTLKQKIGISFEINTATTEANLRNN